MNARTSTRIGVPGAFRNNFSKGPRPPAGWFRSVFLYPDLNSEGTDLSVPTTLLARWIADWDGWYLDCLHRAEGGFAAHRQLLYERSVVLVAPVSAVAMIPERLAGLASSCRELSLRFSLETPVTDDRDLAAIADLVRSVRPAQITLRLIESGASPERELWCRTLDALASARVRTHISGPLDLIRSLSTTSLPALTAVTHSFEPTGHDGPVTTAARGCGLRFGIFVAADGALFSCRGLMGLDAMRLGSVFDVIEDTALGGAPSPLDLDTLALLGPGDALTDDVLPKDGLPAICLRHRRFLESPGTARRAAHSESQR